MPTTAAPNDFGYEVIAVCLEPSIFRYKHNDPADSELAFLTLVPILGTRKVLATGGQERPGDIGV